ncbi:MAG: PIG-L family deacetylase [Methanomicrobiaceae archaeon]|nr:PIG-L family deacetylase [Methanomicrobiaceae archaeon]
MSKKILVIAPHPDDETLGCGGTIAKHCLSGDHLTLCIVTTAHKPDWSDEYIRVRNEQIDNAVKILGFDEVIELGYHTVKLDTIPQKDINEKFSAVIRKVQPDIAYIPYKGDLHRDHRIIFESSLVAMRPFHCNVKKILAYETLSETEWGQPITPYIPNVFSDITETFQKKTEAINAYRTELKEFPHPRSIEAIEALAKKRGSEIGVRYAESFSLVREVF